MKAFSNNMVDMKHFVDFDPEECGVTELVYAPVCSGSCWSSFSGEELKDAIRDRVDDLIPKHIIVDDILASINYLNCLAQQCGDCG